MTRTFFLLSSCAVPGLLAAQCQIGSYSLTADCTQQAPLASIVLSGGTPPYQLVFTGANGTVHTTQSFSNGSFSTFLPTWPSLFEPPVALQVTDALGCVASSSAYYTIHMAMWPEVWFEYACGGSAVELYWMGTYNIAGAPWSQTPCPSDSYLVSGLSGFDQSGTLASAWTEVVPSVWRFNTALPLGTTYSVWMWPSGAPTGCFGGNVFHCHAAGTITVPAAPTNCGVYFQMRAALGGALPSGTTMTDALRTASLVPLTEPYAALGYAYAGMPSNAALQPSTLTVTGNNAVVDWVVVELRSESAPGTVVFSKAALIQRDGDVVEVTGSSNWLHAPVPVGRYHLAIRHRNHLGVMTAGPVWLNGDLTFKVTHLVNFRNSSTSTYGTNARMAVGSVQCLWPGDANFNGSVKYAGSNNDRDAILQAIGGTVPTNTIDNVYSPLDVNMDGTVKYAGSNNDRDIILNTIGGTVPTATRVQQLP